MNLDKTFCTGKRCQKKESCDRYIGHVKKWFESEQGKNHRGRTLDRISLGEFSDHDGKCRLEFKDD